MVFQFAKSLVIFAVLCCVANGQQDMTQYDIAQLVEDLASPRFSVREDAAAGLLAIGEAAVPVIIEAAQSSDPEVRLRCRRLLKKITNNDFESKLAAFLAGDNDGASFAGWDYVKGLIGDDRSTRQLFIEATRLHPDLVESFAKAPEAISTAAKAAAEKINHRLTKEFKSPERGDSVALLLACGDPNVELTNDVEKVIRRLMLGSVLSATLKDITLAKPYQQLVALWIVRAGESFEEGALFLSLQYSLPQSLTLARRVLSAVLEDGQAIDDKRALAIQAAFQVLAKYGTRKDLSGIRRHATDGRSLSVREVQFDQNGQALHLLVKDLAHAVIIQLCEGDLIKAGYPNPKLHPNVVFFTGSLGFPKDGNALRHQVAEYSSSLLSGGKESVDE